MLMTPACSAMDAVLEEAGMVCGSSRASVLMRATIPVLAPAVLASTALGFIRSLESPEIEMVPGIPAGIYVVPRVIFPATHESRALSPLMLDYIAEADQEKSAVLGVFLAVLSFVLLLIGRLLGFWWPAMS
jgi:ABC-type spermidine/putrescine transport system permease subunit II